MRVRYTTASRAKRKKILKRAKGFHGARHLRIKVAKESILHAMTYEYRDRRNKKRDFRRLWISRISAFVRSEGMTYSRFIEGLIKAEVVVNRKVLSNLAIQDPEAMTQFMSVAKTALGK